MEAQPWWESTDFDFVRLPKELFRNPYYAELLPESKLLYGFLLDRACLSRLKGEKWRTPDGQVFVIFTLAEIRERLGCGEKKAGKILKQLRTKELIQVDRPKRDGPYHIRVLPFRRQKGQLAKVRSDGCPDVKSAAGDLSKVRHNNTDINKTDINKTERITLLEEGIRTQIQYEYLISQCPKNQVDTLVEVMAQTLLSTGRTVTVAGVPMDGELVRGYLRKAEVMRIQYIFDHMDTLEQPIRSYRAYFLARLCDPDGAVDAFYEEQHRLDDL